MSLVPDIYSSYSKSYTGSTSGLSPARKNELTEKVRSAVSEYVKNSENAVAHPEITENTETTALSDAGKVRPSGKTIGNVTLSKEANDYLESLKKKYSNLDFIVVSKDQKQAAQANAASYGNKNKTDAEKIERMATDEDFRKKYEGIIESSTKKLQAFGQQLSAGGLSGLVKGFGMNVSGNANTNDGGNSSFFAVIDESLSLQKQRIEKKAAGKKAEKKAAEKKAEKKADDKKAKEKLKEERLEKKKETQERLKDEKLEETENENEDSFDWKKGLYISSESPEALMRALSDYGYKAAEGRVLSKVELTVGKTVDYSG